METVIVSNSQFYSHYPRQIPKGSVNAEQVEIRLDKSWDGLTVRIHWLNVASNVERKPLLERDQPNTIPWEVLTDLGELRMGLVGLDGETVIKPTIWLTYGYVTDGVDPESGSDPQPPTPSWEQQMVEQAKAAAAAAKASQDAAEKAESAAGAAGPYSEKAKKSAEAAKASQDAAATSAQKADQAAKDAQAAAGSIGDAVQRAEQAATAAGSAQRAAETAQTDAAQSAGTAQGAATTAIQAAQTAQGAATQAGQYLASVEADAQAAAAAATAAGKSQDAAQGAAQAADSARDQANTAATTAQGHATAADAAKTAAEQAAATAGSAQAVAAQSAQSAANSASAAQAAQQAAEAAAAVLPKPTREDAGKVPMVNPEGTGYVFGEAGSGGAGGKLQVADYEHQGNQEIHFSSIDWETGVCDCTEPHNLTEPKKVLIVPNNWWDGTNYVGAGVVHIPIEWIVYTGNSIYVVPVDETRVKITGADKTTIIPVDTEDVSNTNLDATKFHVEIPIGFIISNLPVNVQTLRIFAFGFSGLMTYRYVYVLTDTKSGSTPRRVWPTTMLSVPRTGLSKCGYALPFWYDITAEAAAHGTYFDISTLYLGQRQGYSSWIADKTKEDLSSQCAPASDSNAKWFTGIEISSIDACYANHTIFRLYAKAVRE